MKKIIIVFLCCVLLAGCSTAPPTTENTATTISETVATEEITDTTMEPVLIEQAEKEKLPEEKIPSETTETASTTTPTETVLPAATAPSEPPTEEITKPEPIITEPATEEAAPPPEVNSADIERLVVEYINQYRTEQGDTTTTALSGLTVVARYRAEQIITDFSHNSIPDACTVLQYGEFIDMTLYGGIAEDSYYRGYSKEAIGKGDWFGTADQMAERIASGFCNSAGHWSYVGSSEYPYIAVGVVHAENKWYVCICMSAKDYGG